MRKVHRGQSLDSYGYLGDERLRIVFLLFPNFNSFRVNLFGSLLKIKEKKVNFTLWFHVK